MPENTCSTCQCNRVCDHNKYGFENCGNYISDDLLPRAEVAREIFEEIDKEHGENCGAYRIDDLTYGQLWDFLAELKKKYTKE